MDNLTKHVGAVEIKILRGTGVCSGRAQGKVKIVRGVKDEHKFQAGDVLVTRMTNPAMTLMMSRASAIVCDVGGMMSHASILSRELGIPCIVATKNATSSFKDGDIVSVDGETGEVCLVVKEKDWISDFTQSTLTALGCMDVVTLHPFSQFEFHPLFSREWIAWLKKLLDAVDEKKIDYVKLALAGPSETRIQLYFTLLDLKCSKTEKKERMRVANFFRQILNNVAESDPFVLEGKNIIHSEQEVSELIHRLDFVEANEEIAHLLSRIYLAGFHLVNGLYTDIYTDNGVENYGDYDVSNVLEKGNILVIKHLMNLKPVELWEESKKTKYNDVKIYCIYKGVKFKTQFASCHSMYEGDAIKGLTSWAVEADGRQLTSTHELEVLKKNIERSAVEQWKALASQSFEELKVKGLYQRCYVFKSLREFAGLDWRPSQEMIEAVKDKKFDLRKYWKLPEKEEEKLEYWRKILDPRIDFYPA